LAAVTTLNLAFSALETVEKGKKSCRKKGPRDLRVLQRSTLAVWQGSIGILARAVTVKQSFHRSNEDSIFRGKPARKLRKTPPFFPSKIETGAMKSEKISTRR